MRDIEPGLAAHFETGATTICRAWKISRKDGVTLGFTDHDRDLIFDDTVFRAASGLDAAAIQASTGLSVDNSAAIGVLNDLGLEEKDIRAGRYDDAEICAYAVNWAATDQRMLQFRGTIGEIRRSGGVFEAEVRGLSETLNQPQGRAFHRECSAVLGDASCKFNVTDPGYSAEISVPAGRVRFAAEGLGDFDAAWFERGTIEVLSGVNAGMRRSLRSDRIEGGQRTLTIWEAFETPLEEGTQVRLTAGCDKRAETCRLKFHNFLNFRGFPQIPGENWAMAYPKSGQINDGGPLR